MTSRGASAMVFTTSALILVLETIAGRLMAPYVGISLETFTGIIGTVLAGIAAGSAVGGRLADQRDPRPMIGQALLIGGVLTWLAIPIVAALGPAIAATPGGIVVLTAGAFLAPAAVLSAITPMAVKLRLDSLEETGAVVGGLSAAGTVGALVGTFATGFVLVGLLPVRTIMILMGLGLVLAGLGWTLAIKRRFSGLDAALVLVAGGLLLTVPNNCDYDTEYFCARVEVDDERASGRSLWLDHLRHAYVDLDDPTYLEFRYTRLFGTVADGLPAGPIDTLHIGGGGFSFPRYLNAVRPGTSNTVFEIDGALVGIAESELGLSDEDRLDIRIGDARLAIGDLEDNAYDLVVGDAFGSEAVPWHLTTVEFITEVGRVLRPDGIYVLNVIDRDASSFARAEMATLKRRFEHVAVILPSDGVPRRRSVNHILIASDGALPAFDLDTEDGVLVDGDELDEWIDKASALTDDFAPVDQLAG